MSKVGLITITMGVLALWISTIQYLQLRKARTIIKLSLQEDPNATDNLPIPKFNATLAWLALGFLISGGYILTTNYPATFTDLGGGILVIFGLSGLIQSFRPHDTLMLISASGRDPYSLNYYLWRTRIIGLTCMSLGAYMIL